MSNTISFSVELTTIDCGQCGATYAISEKYRVHKYQESGFWHCPYCQCSWGYSEGQNTKLKNQIAQLQTTVEHKEAAIVNLRQQRDAVERSKIALKAAHTRQCNRVKNGVCPCCNRTFQNLAAHMATKHSDYAKP